MLVRKYQLGEEMELWKLYFNTIRTINIRDYTLEQVQAWAPEKVDEKQWRARIQGINPYVCVADGVIVGYADLQETGVIDHFFVHHQWQARGVGKRLLATIESEAEARSLSELSANVSITARPFFEPRGFRVLATQEVRLGAIVLCNFRMVKKLDVGQLEEA